MKTIHFLKQAAAALLAAMLTLCFLTACGSTDTPASTGPATTVQTDPAETIREVTVVGEQMRHMTYNIAGSNTLERIPNFDLSETKRANIKKIIEEIDPDTLGIQEAPKAWIEGMVGLLDNKYAMVGGYSDEIGANEKFWYNPIYYKTDVFSCLDSGVLFLDEGFVYNKNNRNCAFALLERIDDGELVLILSVHLEHRVLGSDDLKSYNYTNYYEQSADRNLLRDKQIGYLCQIINAKLSQYGSQYDKEISVLVSGDFNINAWQDDQYEHEYTRLCETMGSIVNTPGMRDSVTVATELVTNQTKSTWQTYRDYFSEDAPTARLDYIFVSNNLVVNTFTVYDTPYEMADSSDHHPVYAEYMIGH